MPARNSERVAAARSAVAEAAAVLVDLDGCLAIRNRVVPGAFTLAELAGPRLVVVSNNSTHLPSQIATTLRQQGLPIRRSNVVLAGTAALDMIAADYPRARVMILGTPAIVRRAKRLGLRLDHKKPDVVLLTRDLDLSFSRIDGAVSAIIRGARLVVANPDLTHPTEGGIPTPETGALLTVIKACIPGLAYRVIGKPEAPLFRLGLARLGAEAKRSIMIGDNPTTDIAGAEAIGMRAFLVGHVRGSVSPSLGALLGRSRS